MSRRAGWWLAAVLAAALVLRLGFVYAQTQYHLLAVTNDPPDAVRYQKLAKNILAGKGFSYDGREPTAADSPGFPLMLAGLEAAFGPGPGPVRLAQALLATGVVALAFALAGRLFGPRAGLIAALLAALDPLNFFYLCMPLTETLYGFLLILFLYLAVRGRERPGWGLAAGLAAGAGALTRPVLTGFAGLVALARIIHPSRRRAALALILGLAILLAPWAARNWAVMDTPTLHTRMGLELYGGNAPDSNGGSGGYLSWGQDVAWPPPTPAGMGEVADNQRLIDLTLAGLATDPSLIWRRLPGKIWNMWRPTWAGASLKNALALGGMYVLTLAAALAGLFIPAVRRRGALLWGLIIYHVAAHAVIYGIIRYRAPLEPVLAVLAGGGLEGLWLAWRGRQGTVEHMREASSLERAA